MQKLTDFTSYADAMRQFSKPALWALFDGDRERLNIAHECVDRHPGGAMAVRIAHEAGGYEDITFGDLALWSNRVANFLVGQGVAPGDRVAIMLDPSLACRFWISRIKVFVTDWRKMPQECGSSVEKEANCLFATRFPRILGCITSGSAHCRSLRRARKRREPR